MRLREVRIGMRVKVTRLGSTEGMAVKPKYLQARRLGARGKIMNYIAGHGGDCWWIRHDDGTIGGYGYMEFQRVRSKRRTGERTK